MLLASISLLKNAAMYLIHSARLSGPGSAVALRGRREGRRGVARQPGQQERAEGQLAARAITPGQRSHCRCFPAAVAPPTPDERAHGKSTSLGWLPEKPMNTASLLSYIAAIASLARASAPGSALST
jgi:hypothetical protein